MSFSLFSLLPRSITSRGNGPDYIPLADTRSGVTRKSRWRHHFANGTNATPTPVAFAFAILAGIFICIILLSFYRRPEYDGSLHPTNVSSIFTSPNTVLSDSDNLSLELGDIVARSKGYWARDYSLNLGWNNVSAYRFASDVDQIPIWFLKMRYIIETALLHGALLNRTVILPSFVYARSCEYDV